MEAPEPPPQDFPAGPVGKSPPATARDTGSVPGLRRSYMCCEAHVPQLPKPTLFSPHATTSEPAPHMQRSHRNGKPRHHGERRPCLPQPEKARITATRTWHSRVNKNRLERCSLAAQLGKNLPAQQETPVRFLGGEDSLEKGKATHFSILGLASLVPQLVKNLPAVWETWVRSLG